MFIIGHLRGERTREVFPIEVASRQIISRPSPGYINLPIAMTQKKAKKIDIAMTLCASGPSKGRGNDSPVNGVLVFNDILHDPKTIQQNGKGWNDQGYAYTLDTWETQGIYDGARIRRFTPLECFRLQGFPDEFVAKARAVGISDSQLYKIAGNSVTVPVIHEIAKRLV